MGYAGKGVLPGSREDYKFAKGFRPELEIYNIHRAMQEEKANDYLIVAPDILDVWRLHEAGYSNAVSILGNRPSFRQVMTLFIHIGENGRILIFSNDDLANGDVCNMWATFDKRAMGISCMRILFRLEIIHIFIVFLMIWACWQPLV